MKKKLDETTITNELRGGSAFFPGAAANGQTTPQDTAAVASGVALPARATAVPATKLVQRATAQHPSAAPRPGSKQSTTRDTVPPYNHATTVAPHHDELIELLRGAVRHLGKETATYRLRPQEKKALSDIVYTYKGRGIRTSENEVVRIGVNWLVEDYRQHGAASVLALVLERLNQ
jgi:hypothetical protein